MEWDAELWRHRDAGANGQSAAPSAETPRAGLDGTNRRCWTGRRLEPQTGWTVPSPACPLGAVGARATSWTDVRLPRKSDHPLGPHAPGALPAAGAIPSKHGWLESSLYPGRFRPYSFPLPQSLLLPEAYLLHPPGQGPMKKEPKLGWNLSL